MLRALQPQEENFDMSIVFDEKSKFFSLMTKNTEYQIKINELGMVLHTYYGKKVNGFDMSYLLKELDRGFSGNPYECRNVTISTRWRKHDRCAKQNWGRISNSNY